jgi:carboxyl-terminal processing protease
MQSAFALAAPLRLQSLQLQTRQCTSPPVSPAQKFAPGTPLLPARRYRAGTHARSPYISACASKEPENGVDPNANAEKDAALDTLASAASTGALDPSLESEDEELDVVGARIALLWSAFLSGLRRAFAPGGFVWGVGAGLVIAAAVLLYPLSFGEGGLLTSPPAPGATAKVQSVEAILREKSTLFEIILNDIASGYVDAVDLDALFSAGVNAMLGSLDPYTTFESVGDAVELSVRTSGKYGGVGLGISSGNVLDKARAAPDGQKRIVVVSAFEHFAYDRGVRPGDVIDAVDGQPTAGMTVSAVTDALRGEPGTTVEISVLRQGVPHPIAFTLARQNVLLRDVPVTTILHGDTGPIGYIRLQSFAKDAPAEVKTAIDELIAEAAAANAETGAAGKGLRGLILDLRGNPGGLLNAAIEISEAFVPKGSVIVSTKGREGGQGPIYVSNRDPTAPADLPLAVLVNGQSASASEIVAGAIQDLDRGVIVGSKTFGKGLVQNVEGLPYRTALKLTVGRYQTPSGRCIQALNYDQKDASTGQYEAKTIAEGDRKEFLTRGGRVVRDGGGIEPDVTLKKQGSFLANALQRQGLFFHFASKYAAEIKSEILPPDFQVTDGIYKEFVRFVGSPEANFKYEGLSKFDESFDQLEGLFSDVGYENAKSKVAELRRATEGEMRLDFMRHELDIKAEIESAIRSRLQPDSARMVAELKNDPQVLEATRLLQSPVEYNQLLSPAPKYATADSTDGSPSTTITTVASSTAAVFPSTPDHSVSPRIVE